MSTRITESSLLDVPLKLGSTMKWLTKHWPLKKTSPGNPSVDSVYHLFEVWKDLCNKPEPYLVCGYVLNVWSMLELICNFKEVKIEHYPEFCECFWAFLIKIHTSAKTLHAQISAISLECTTGVVFHAVEFGLCGVQCFLRHRPFLENYPACLGGLGSQDTGVNTVFSPKAATMLSRCLLLIQIAPLSSCFGRGQKTFNGAYLRGRSCVMHLTEMPAMGLILVL